MTYLKGYRQEGDCLTWCDIQLILFNSITCSSHKDIVGIKPIKFETMPTSFPLED